MLSTFTLLFGLLSWTKAKTKYKKLIIEKGFTKKNVWKILLSANSAYLLFLSGSSWRFWQQRIRIWQSGSRASYQMVVSCCFEIGKQNFGIPKSKKSKILIYIVFCKPINSLHLQSMSKFNISSKEKIKFLNLILLILANIVLKLCNHKYVFNSL